MVEAYTMNETMRVAEQGTQDITEWLNRQEQVLRVENVEENPEFQRIDVDLIVYCNDGTEQKIEIKVDRNCDTGNFFFETVSNNERGTPGCFMYTEADRLFYYFPDKRELYSLRMPELREWFVNNMDRFKEVITQTLVRNNQRYTTIGRLVKIEIVSRECPNLIRKIII